MLNAAIFYLVPVLLFSLLGRSAGYIAAVSAMVIQIASTWIHGFEGLAVNPIEYHLIGVVLFLLVTYSVGTVRKMYITMKKTEILIQRSREKYKKVVDNIREGMIIIDFQGNVVFMNRACAALLGRSEREVNFNVFDLLDRSNGSRIQDEIEKRKHGIPSNYEVEYEHPRKGKRKVFIAATPSFDFEGRIDGSIGFLTDITDTTKMHDDLIVLQRRNEYLIAEMQHRIGNNLAVIKSLLGLYRHDSNIKKEAILGRLSNLIDAISLLNNKFFDSFETQTVQIKDLFQQLGRDFASEHGYNQNLLETRVEDIGIHIDTALPLGMIYTILITNVMEQSRKQSSPLTLTIEEGKEGLVMTLTGSLKQCIAKDRLKSKSESENEILNSLIKQIRGTLVFSSGEPDRLVLTFTR
jgi:PAS domain S-box-containing protein